MNDAKIPSFSEYCFAKKAKYLLNRMQESHHEMTCKFIYHDVDSRVEKGKGINSLKYSKLSSLFSELKMLSSLFSELK